MKRILVVANDFPYPPNHGAALDIWTRLLTLKRMGFQLDLLVSVRLSPKDDDIVTVRHIVDRLWMVPRDRSWRAALSLLPFQVSSRRKLASVSLGQRYDAIIFEAEHVGAFLDNPAAQGARLVLRVHNDEARYFRALSKGNVGWRTKLFYFIESLKFRLYSPKIRKCSNVLCFISDSERSKHVTKFPSDAAKSLFLPPDIPSASMRPFLAGGSQVLFIGTLTIPHNADAIEWYIDSVHPLLRDADGYRLIVAGHTGGQPIESLRRKIAHHRNITLVEDSTDLVPLYEASAVFINPVLRGAGLKLKTIHALQAGVPVVTTSIGIDGTGLRDKEHVLVADKAHDFAQAVRQLMQDHARARKLVHAAQTFLMANYNAETKLRSLLGSPPTDEESRFPPLPDPAADTLA